MKKLLLFALTIMATLQLTAQDMLVGTYNIRYKAWNDSVQGEIWQKTLPGDMRPGELHGA